MAPLIADSRLILSRSGEFPSRAREERDRVFVDPKLDGHGLGRTEPNANQFPTEHCAEPAVHLLGIDHKRLTYRHNGIDRRLTDVHGEVIREVLA